MTQQVSLLASRVGGGRVDGGRRHRSVDPAHTGEVVAESRGEVQEIVDTCDFFAGEGRRLYGQTVPSEMPDKQLFAFRQPVGVAAVVTAGNFPVAVPCWYLVPALLCGNAVVWKPAEVAPATAFRFREGVSAGMVSVTNSTSGAEAHLPAGGNGRSGNGSRQSGIWVLEQFTRWQALNWDFSGRLQKAQMDVAEPAPDRDFRL